MMKVKSFLVTSTVIRTYKQVTIAGCIQPICDYLYRHFLNLLPTDNQTAHHTTAFSWF